MPTVTRDGDVRIVFFAFSSRGKLAVLRCLTHRQTQNRICIRGCFAHEPNKLTAGHLKLENWLCERPLYLTKLLNKLHDIYIYIYMYIYIYIFIYICICICISNFTAMNSDARQHSNISRTLDANYLKWLHVQRRMRIT